jgi:DNA repair protein RadC
MGAMPFTFFGERRCDMSGSRDINVVKLQVIKDRSVDYGIERVQQPRDLAEIGRKFIGDSDREMFVLVCLDTQNHINALNIVSIGCLNSSVVHPREVFKLVVLNNSASIAFIHPSKLEYSSYAFIVIRPPQNHEANIGSSLVSIVCLTRGKAPSLYQAM